MYFYRPLGAIAALTFDLDDTLYDNRPVIARTEQETLAFMQCYHPRLSAFTAADLHRASRSRRSITT
ncbi:2-haloalkanoic acid dehalogenase [Cronobacter universalis NCTC 9529]|nr:2-haloalkanoic acid dehalogenase [Cronobacter universalis NCTC 9529]